MNNEKDGGRRAFLRAGLLTGAAALISSMAGCGSDEAPVPEPGAKVPLLDTNGNLLLVDEKLASGPSVAFIAPLLIAS